MYFFPSQLLIKYFSVQEIQDEHEAAICLKTLSFSIDFGIIIITRMHGLYGHNLSDLPNNNNKKKNLVSIS
jgi:hypothetical protein